MAIVPVETDVIKPGDCEDLARLGVSRWRDEAFFWRGTVSKMSTTTKENENSLHTFPAHEEPPLGQFFCDPPFTHQTLNNFVVRQVPERLKLSPISAVRLGIGPELASLQCESVKIDYFALEERNDMSAWSRRCLIGDVARLHCPGKSHVIVVDTVNGDLDRPIFFLVISKTVKILR